MTEDEKRALIEGFVADLFKKGYSRDQVIDAMLDLLNEFIKEQEKNNV